MFDIKKEAKNVKAVRGRIKISVSKSIKRELRKRSYISGHNNFRSNYVVVVIVVVVVFVSFAIHPVYIILNRKEL